MTAIYLSAFGQQVEQRHCHWLHATISLFVEQALKCLMTSRWGQIIILLKEDFCVFYYLIILLASV